MKFQFEELQTKNRSFSKTIAKQEDSKAAKDICSQAISMELSPDMRQEVEQFSGSTVAQVDFVDSLIASLA